MSLAVLRSRALAGMRAPEVMVEAHLANGLPAFTIVGLPEAEVRESRDRVRAAILNSRFEFPARRITVNLAPADLPKESGRYDLPIALGILAAAGQIPPNAVENAEFAGELALSGALRPVRGALAMAAGVADSGRDFFLPRENAAEAALVREARIFPAGSLLEVCAHLSRHSLIQPHISPTDTMSAADGPDLNEVRGQAGAKRALEIAAAGGHSLLMSGPPGSGKSMLASRLPGILPQMSEAEAMESAALLSLKGDFHSEHWRRRPFRAPHHTASTAALVGGGTHPRPGEISLAHHGILFLDELPEFSRTVLEALREPLETGQISLSRAARQVEYPARFQLVAAMNPCPCGHLGNPDATCRCTAEQIARYRNKLSGPLLDRIDLQIEVPALPGTALLGNACEEPSSSVRERVRQARERQLSRQGKANAALNASETERHCAATPEAFALLQQAMQRLQLSARGWHRILRLARTIADLQDSGHTGREHVAEAIQYRRFHSTIH